MSETSTPDPDLPPRSVVDDVRASLERLEQQEPEEQVSTYTSLEETLRSSLRSAGDEPA